MLKEYNPLHYVKSVQIRRCFWSVFSCVQSEYMKMWTIKNSAFRNFLPSAKYTINFIKLTITSFASTICSPIGLRHFEFNMVKNCQCSQLIAINSLKNHTLSICDNWTQNEIIFALKCMLSLTFFLQYISF